MAFDLRHGHAALRLGRWSESGADYFLTICTHERTKGLTGPLIVSAIWRESDRLADESVWLMRTAVVMPDHLHLLVTLQGKADLSSAVRQFKGRLTPVLRQYGLRWQQAYFDHRLRVNEDRLPVFLYIFLNPYRAGLIPSSKSWPGYRCHPDDWTWFGPMTNSSCPMPEWLD
jgi:REP element-mobilizing transposase RayT